MDSKKAKIVRLPLGFNKYEPCEGVYIRPGATMTLQTEMPQIMGRALLVSMGSRDEHKGNDGSVRVVSVATVGKESKLPKTTPREEAAALTTLEQKDNES